MVLTGVVDGLKKMFVGEVSPEVNVNDVIMVIIDVCLSTGEVEYGEMPPETLTKIAWIIYFILDDPTIERLLPPQVSSSLLDMSKNRLILYDKVSEIMNKKSPTHHSHSDDPTTESVPRLYTSTPKTVSSLDWILPCCFRRTYSS